MSKQSTLRAINHSSKVITLTKTLIRMNILKVDSPARFRLMPDIVPRDQAKQRSFLQNLYSYARIGLELDERHVLEIFDAETDQKICDIAKSNVSMDSSYIFT